MNNFGRTLRLALRHRSTLIGILLGSSAVAALWCVNLAVVYPIIEVVFQGRSLHEWVDNNTTQAHQTIAEMEGEIALLQKKIDAGDSNENGVYLESQISQCKSRIHAERQVITRGQWLRPWIQRYLPDKPFPTLICVVGFLLVGTLLKSGFLVASIIFVERIAEKVTLDLRGLLYEKTLHMDLGQFGSEGTSRMLSHFTHDMDGITSGVRTVFGRALREPLKIITCLGGAAFVCWRLLLFSLLVTPISMYLISRLAKSVKRANRRAMDEMSNLYGQLTESLNNIQAVKAFTQEDHEQIKFGGLAKQYYRKMMKIAAYNSLTKTTTEVMSVAVVCLAILAGGYLVLNRETHLLGIKMSSRPLTFGSLMAFFALLAGVSDPFRKLAEVYNQIQRGEASADRIYRLLDRSTAVPEAEHPTPITTPLETIKLENVSFHYDPQQPVLRDIDLEIQAGETLAIVGPNGCGKSTLLNLLLRFYDPQHGRVAWNGQDLRQLDMEQLRKQFGLVTQQTLLFDDTVENNIRYGLPEATHDQVVQAAVQAHADGFIRKKLSKGYETMVGSGGKKLSGGQRQRIALARAILRDPAVLVLDEATSQIDLESERLIHETLQRFVKNRTAVMITHRLSTLALADRVLVMEAGQIVDLGPHRELIQRCELYANLHQRQAEKQKAA